MDGKWTGNSKSRELLAEAGGQNAVLRAVSRFYARMFTDKRIQQFVQNEGDPHAARLASWIAEKLGDGVPWTQERAVRPRCPVRLGDGTSDHVVHDR